MVSEFFFYQPGLIALVWLCVLLQWMWPSAPRMAQKLMRPRGHST